jgi:glycosyltransferase involved in cell wall biosynthesis
MKPLVSIGLPVQNGFSDRSNKDLTVEDIDLSKTLNAILKQDYTNLEIIISNNCSTDKTQDYLEEISKTDNRIKLFNQKKELSWAENFRFVLNKSTGKYFRWNAADDMISKDYIYHNIQFLENNLDYVSSSSKCYYQNKPEIVNSYNLDKNLYHRIKGFFVIRDIAHNILYSLVRRETMYKTIDISEDYFAVDWTFDLDLLFCGKFKTLDKGHVFYGTKGLSKQKNFIDRDIYTKKKIYKLFPFYELVKNLFKKTIFLKELSLLEKISIYYSLIRMNLHFLKMHRFIELKKLLEKIK